MTRYPIRSLIYFFSILLEIPVISNVALSLIFGLALLHSAKVMHDTLLKSVLRWPMKSFDTTPIGRILNRFSKDVDTLDIYLPHLIKYVMFFIFEVGNPCYGIGKVFDTNWLFIYSCDSGPRYIIHY